MIPKLVGWVGAILLLIAVVLLFFFFLNVLAFVIFAIGLVVFGAIVAVLVISALVMILAVPLYFVTKPAQIEPASTVTLDRLKER